MALFLAQKFSTGHLFNASLFSVNAYFHVQKNEFSLTSKESLKSNPCSLVSKSYDWIRHFFENGSPFAKKKREDLAKIFVVQCPVATMHMHSSPCVSVCLVWSLSIAIFDPLAENTWPYRRVCWNKLANLMYCWYWQQFRTSPR